MGDNAPSVDPQAWRTSVPLFGGAITCDLPGSFSDMSELREVPDHQEVWCDIISDRSVIVEILERKSLSDEQAVEFFLSDLAVCNEARDTSVVSERQVLVVEETPGLPADVRCFYAVTDQTVAKFKEACGNRVLIHLLIIRLVAQETDILVSLNDPVSIDPQSSSAGVPVVQGSNEVFAAIMKSFKIVDWDLFG